MNNVPWTARFYIAGRFGSMMERRFTFDAALRHEVAVKLAERKLAAFQRNNVAVYPRYDLVKETGR